MINEDNLNKLCNSILEGVELTTKELNRYGFNSKDLNELIENGRLIRVKRGIYSIKSVDDLFYYGKRLISQKEYDKATNCFKKCFELDPNHAGVCFQLFLKCIEDKDYMNAFKYFEVFYNGKNEFYNIDCKFYLYLLNMITNVPLKYREMVKNLDYNDIKVLPNDKRYENIYFQNKMRLSAFNQRLKLASKQLSEITKEKGRVSVQDIVIRLLITQALDIQIKNRNAILNLIKEKNYEGAIIFHKRIRFI